MDNSRKAMDKTTPDRFEVYREDRFRVPIPVERTLGLWVTWNGPEGKVLEDLGYMNPLQPVFPDPDGTPLQAASKLSPILLNEDPASALKRKSILLNMVYKVHTAANFAASPLPRYTTMEKTVEIIHDRYKENLKIPELAEEVHLSPTFAEIRAKTKFLKNFVS
ncbi:MAG: hypothetical protein R6V56_07565 [Lentisphaeria bacterium]